MKSSLTNFGLFIAAALALSVFASCSGTNSPQNAPANNASVAQSNAPANADPEKKKTDYPPIATAVAQADLKNLDGTTFKVADKKGKVLLLNLWATWCGPCRSEMPTLVKMQEAHREKGLEIIGLDTDDETVEDINKFAADMKLNYTLVWADTAIQAALLNISKFNGIPQSFIVDRDGNLRGVFRGANPADVKKMNDLVEMIVNE
ncbi:MAG TPA: TlpA disulfide reductase family protein [Pyrinomonadaceae bacterium]|nr:TlpA disulfide reductase family protein [Pyrinomonadaceae bacterium]